VASLSLRLPDQPEQLLPPHTSIVQAYELAQQELLILGEPGAGKSTQLLELAYHLVEQAEHDATHPLPVLLPLSSWATAHPFK
jgi:predicted NACHT family NTPase